MKPKKINVYQKPAGSDTYTYLYSTEWYRRCKDAIMGLEMRGRHCDVGGKPVCVDKNAKLKACFD